MALQPNKMTGKAVADIDALYFLKHEAGEEPVVLDTLDSEDWFPVLTLRGTVTASQDAPSLDEIHVDQFDAAIGITTEPGQFSFEAQLPSMMREDIENWLGEDLEVTDKQIDGRQVIGFNLSGKLDDTAVLIKTDTGDTILFSHVQLSLSFSKEDKVFIFRVAGQVLAASNPANKMIYIAHEKYVEAPTGVTLNKSTLSLAVGANETLTATVAPEGASQKVIWTSSDSTKATVDSNGKVTAVATASGAAAPKIRATAKDDETVYAECTVTVTAS